MNNIMDITYTVPMQGMTCAHCERTITQALEGVGAHDVRTSFRIGEAIFKAPVRGAGPERFMEAIRNAGYEPGSIIPINSGSGRSSGRREKPDGASRTAIGTKQGLDGKAAVEYDLAIIGSGGAAMAAAITATESGARIVMVERGAIGGTCVNIGCVPSKTLLRAAEIYHNARHHPFEGIPTSAGAVDLAALVRQKDELVEEMRKDKYADLIIDYGWDFVQGEARFVDEQTLAVGRRRIKANSYIVATGADPAAPPIPGLQEAGYLTSTSALAMTKLPQSLFVIGAGYVALELCQLFSRLGSRVTLAQRGPHLLTEHEPEIGELMAEVLGEQGIKLITDAHVESIESVERVERLESAGKNGEMRKVLRIHLTVNGKREVHEADQVLVATGRRPNTDALNLGAASIDVDERGAIVVDAQLRTTNPRVWAAGDVNHGPQFVYVASYEGKLAAENALRSAGRTLDFTALPQVIFTDPQVAVVGMTEQEARAQGRPVKSTVLPLDIVPRAQVNHYTVGLIKLIAEEVSNRILGVHVVAENAGDIIYAGTLAVKFGLSVEDLVESFAPYLTMSEALKLAALSFGRDVHKLSCCAA